MGDSNNSGGNTGKNIFWSVIAILAVIAIIVFYLFNQRVDERENLRFEEDAQVPTETVVEPAVAPMAEQGEMLGNEGTLTMPYGTYTGGMIDGYPDGEGRMLYRIRTRISERDSMRYADPGQYIIGRWRRGELMEGNLYDENNEPIYGFNWW